MPYRSSYDLLGRWGKPQVTAIVPTSILTGLIGSGILVILILVTVPDVRTMPIGEIFAMLALSGLAIAFAAVTAMFIVAFYIVLFGLPFALVLHERMRRPYSLPFALVIATVTGMLAGWQFSGWDPNYLYRPDKRTLIFLGFALPAGYFYRKFVIAAMDAVDDE